MFYNMRTFYAQMRTVYALNAYICSVRQVDYVVLPNMNEMTLTLLTLKTMKFKEAIILLLAMLFIGNGMSAQNATGPFAVPSDVTMKTVTYATKDGNTLQMDIYQKENYNGAPQPVMFYMFAGAFYAGERKGQEIAYYLGQLAQRGITGISIDYRLGWKDAFKGKPEDYGMIEKLLDAVQNTRLMQKTFDMPVEDLYTATNYVIEHARELKVDPSRIMISGSSAGAMSVLRAEYFLKSGNPLAKVLPAGFTYKGVLSFAGAIYSNQGMPVYTQAPAPTLFIHGSKDIVLRYKGIRFLKEGLFTSKLLVREYKKHDYPYVFLTLRGAGHGEGCGDALINNFEDAWTFIQEYVYGGKRESKEYKQKYSRKTAIFKKDKAEEISFF